MRRRGALRVLVGGAPAAAAAWAASRFCFCHRFGLRLLALERRDLFVEARHVGMLAR